MVDKEHLKGAADKMKGAAKEAVGKVTGSDRLVAEGKADKAEGAARQTIGDVKDAGKKAADSIKR
ncbi:CsbD family protein [Methylocella sp.]|uniref:CsbD family protein n=1 Tax=Methylocella sp. TaxID=1978226 RepID=UPI003783B308